MSHPLLIFQHLNFPLLDAHDDDANTPGISLTLPINLCRSRNPKGSGHIPSPDHIATVDEAQIQLRWAAIAKFVVVPLLRNVADAKDWFLTDPHTVLNLLTNLSDDQAAILQMSAHELDLASATDI
jgi:hypothetical protein